MTAAMTEAEAKLPIKPLPARTAAMVVAEVLLPLLARGLIIRRRPAVRVLARLDADRRAVERLRAVRAAHGPGPVLVKLPRRDVVVILSSADARRVLDASPKPFTPANREKRAALSRFEPHGVLISAAQERPARRAFNEQALDTGRPLHHFAGPLSARVAAEVDALLEQTGPVGELGWPQFQRSFNRIVRGVILGDSAIDDEALTEELNALRADANWGYLLPKRRRLREQFLARLRKYLEQPDSRALSGHIAGIGRDDPETLRQAVDQVPQWLFAFDAAAIASFAVLALLWTHPAQLLRARAEAEPSGSGEEPGELPFLRACVLEVLRLWPTTPAILRDTTAETTWPAGRLPRGSAVLIFAPLFHREGTLHPHTDSFAPERWLDLAGTGLRADDPDPRTALIPFSGGPGRCPGRDLVLLVTSQLIARMLQLAELELTGPAVSNLRPGHPLPVTLDHFQLGFRVHRHEPMRHRQQERTAT